MAQRTVTMPLHGAMQPVWSLQVRKELTYLNYKIYLHKFKIWIDKLYSSRSTQKYLPAQGHHDHQKREIFLIVDYVKGIGTGFENLILFQDLAKSLNVLSHK